MEEDDEIDVLGDFNLESLLTKNEDQISTYYDGDNHLGLECESQWSTPQSCWNENKPGRHQPAGCSSLEAYDSNVWSDKEKYLLDKGLELFGKSWSRLAQYIGTKTANQVKSYMKAMGIDWACKSSGSTSSFGVESMDFNYSELINDMDIPASVEEVIAAVSTAQPTVVLPSPQREIPTVHSYSSKSRKLKIRRKKNNFVESKRRLVTETPKGTTQVFNAEDIKDVLTGSKECDHVVLPNGEQVIRIRHSSNLSEDSDVDIDSEWDKTDDRISVEEKDPCTDEKQELNECTFDTDKLFQCKQETVPNKTLNEGEENEVCFVEDIGKEVSVFTDNVLEDKREYAKKETQIFKGSLVTPSGKVMTVIVDDMPCPSDDAQHHYNRKYHRNDSSKITHCAIDSKEQACVVSASDHERVEKLERCNTRRKKESHPSVSRNKLKGNGNRSCATKKEFKISPRWRPAKKKAHTQEIKGGFTMIHTESGEVVNSYESSKNNGSNTSKKRDNTKTIKPIKLIHCKKHSIGNPAPFRVEMEVSALVLVDIHSHLSSESEVIGLLGGIYSAHSGILSITAAVPCRTIRSSNTHCDMCPVSQLESSETITNRGLTVVGWYHSHPDFDPSPSDTDIGTQNMLQSWFNEVGKPFVGLIISPYCSIQRVSCYRFCHVVMEKHGLVPYKLDCKVTNINANIILLRKSIEAAYKTLQARERVQKKIIYRCMMSVRHHLRKTSPRVEEEKVTQVIWEIHDFLASVPVTL